MDRPQRRSQTGLVLAAAVIVIAGVGVGLVAMLIQTYRWPRASILGVVGITVLVVALIRRMSTPRS